MGDKPVIFLYSSIFLYPMLYSCRNSFGKWNFFVIFLIYIPKKKSSGAKNNEIVIAKIDKQSAKDKKPEGRIVEVLGSMNEAGVDMLSLIKEYKLPNEFPEPVLEEARQVSQTLDRKNILQRVDLRGEEIFTIDGEDAKDLDDAVNVKKNDDGTYTLGVHIADVSFYVKSGSKLDKEAIKRGTSVYMMDRVIPMLPKELSNGICSLNENQDRFTISVIMKINKNGKVIESRIFKSVIKTTKRMNYHDVNDLFLWSDINEGKCYFLKTAAILFTLIICALEIVYNNLSHDNICRIHCVHEQHYYSLAPFYLSFCPCHYPHYK